MARKMKGSGIEWIGEIPTDFSLYKLKYLLSSPLCYGANESGTLYSDILPRYIRITDISPNGTLKNSGMLSLDESSAQNYMLHEGDILFARSGATVGKSFIYHNYYGRAAYAGYLIKASFNRLVLPEFVYYYTCSSAYEIWKNSIFIQSTIQNIGADRYSNLPISVPNSIDKQLRIVRYLNNFCSKFDAIIYNLQTSIEDYKKLKQAVITQAVTKGVRGEREMKDSGVEWIGEINHRFSLIKLKYICSILDQYRKPISADKRSQSGSVLYDYYGASGAIDKIDDYTIDDHVMLIGEDGANLRMRNLPLMYEVNGKAWINNHAHILKPTERVDFYYLFYALEELDINPYITGSAQPKLSQEKLQNIWVPLPDLEEQQEIATYIRSKCAEIDKLIAKKEQLIKELESYKKSLIYEVVTGKREV